MRGVAPVVRVSRQVMQHVIISTPCLEDKHNYIHTLQLKYLDKYKNVSPDKSNVGYSSELCMRKFHLLVCVCARVQY